MEEVRDRQERFSATESKSTSSAEGSYEVPTDISVWYGIYIHDVLENYAVQLTVKRLHAVSPLDMKFNGKELQVCPWLL